MTKLHLRALDIPSIHKVGIGFDDLFDDLSRMTAQHSLNYPPYNIVKQTEDNFFIEIATAGFSEGEVTISLDNRLLKVKGRNTRDVDESTEYVHEYLHRGISSRDFEREFTLADHVEVTKASQKDGILTIYLERKIPEDKLPKTIAIDYKS